MEYFAGYYCNFVLKRCVKYEVYGYNFFRKFTKFANETTAILFFASSVSTSRNWNFLQIFKKEICEWVVPEKIHTPPTEEISAVRVGRGDKNVFRTSEGGRAVNFQFPPWGWYGCFLEWPNRFFLSNSNPVFFGYLFQFSDVFGPTYAGTDHWSLYRVRTKLECPWMSLNLKTKIQGLECPWICKEVLECPWILLALVFGYFLKLFDIQDGHFVELILHVHIWPHYKVTFWTIQRQILLISNAFFSI